MNTGLKLTYEIIKLNLKHTWTIARNSTNFKQNVIVRLEKDGKTGYGEAAPNTRYGETAESTVAIIEKAIPMFEKCDPLNYLDIGFKIQQLDRGQTAAKAALDIALLDWVTKSLGLPLYRFLGLNKTKTPVSTFSIGIDTPDIIKKKVKEADRFPQLKIKLGADNDEEIIRAVRSVTDKPIRIDANEGWNNKEQALDKIKWLITQGTELIEQPMPAAMLEETRWLREQIDIPIFADESVKTCHDIPKLSGVFDGINIKLMKAGGIQEALRMIWSAKMFGMKIMLGCMVESSVAISAAANISPLVDFADLDGNLMISEDPFDGVYINRGNIVLNDLPGIGVTEKKNFKFK